MFRAYGPQPAGDDQVCEVPFFTSKQIAVTEAGHYRLGTTTTHEAGRAYWLETL